MFSTTILLMKGILAFLGVFSILPVPGGPPPTARAHTVSAEQIQ